MSFGVIYCDNLHRPAPLYIIEWLDQEQLECNAAILIIYWGPETG